MLNGILWILRTGTSWADLPDRHPSKPASGGFAQQFVNQLPVRLIGDDAHELDRLDAELARRAVAWN